MKNSRFNPTQIVSILKKFESTQNVESITEEHGISKTTLYKWRQRYKNMEAGEIDRIKQLEEENAHLKRLNAELTIELDMAKFVIMKKL